MLPYGAGNIIYLGWTWANAIPLGTQDDGWLEALNDAVLTRVVPASVP